MSPTPIEITGEGNPREWLLGSVTRRHDVPLVLSAEAESTLPLMRKEGHPKTIGVAEAISSEEQEMTRTDVVATWDGPINLFCAIGLTLEKCLAAGTF